MIFIKFGMGRESQVSTLTLYFTIVALKMCAYCCLQIIQICNLWYKFALRINPVGGHRKI